MYTNQKRIRLGEVVGHLLAFVLVRGIGPVVALARIRRLDVQHAPYEAVQLVEFGQAQIDLPLEIVLELVGTAPGGADGRHEIGHALGLGQGQEVAHLAGGEPYEMQSAPPASYAHVIHLHGEEKQKLHRDKHFDLAGYVWRRKNGLSEARCSAPIFLFL